MTPFDLAAILIALAACFGLVNHHWLRLPTPIGLVVVALFASLGVMGLEWAVPWLQVEETVRTTVLGVDFHETVMNGMLSFLLFAGALHVDFEDLRREKWAIGALATVGVLLSTFLVALGFQWLAGVPFIVALVFGALISPTDPVAVLGILKTIEVPRSLETRITGESLFNDGVGIVLFLIVSALAFGRGEPVGPVEVLELFAVEALGGAAFGAFTGWLAYLALRSVDEYTLEVMLTLALVMGTYAACSALGLSGPIAVVVAGLFIGNHGVRFGMSETTREHLLSFWHLLDELLNAVLFLLIGIEVFAIPLGETRYLPTVLLAIPLVLAARLVSVGVPTLLLGRFRPAPPGAVPVMTWGGLRGGISVALVLSLPASADKPLLLAATYAVVIFSIVVQGLTVRRVIGRYAGPDDGISRDPRAAD